MKLYIKTNLYDDIIENVLTIHQNTNHIKIHFEKDNRILTRTILLSSLISYDIFN